ncbi:hypothetical protein MMC22_001994 [Lobaria immixta]|nr:hypothetical protein [Lobaria immixta]
MTCDLERPCTRCVKRNISHLCHDEPREPVRVVKGEQDTAIGEDEAVLKQEEIPPANGLPSTEQRPEEEEPPQLLQETGVDLIATASPANGQRDSSQLALSPSVSGSQSKGLGAKTQPFLGYSDWSLGGQNQFQDMHSLHPSYMFNAPEVTNEYNLLNDFLSSSLLDDAALFPNDDNPGLYSDPSLANTVTATANGSSGQYFSVQQPNQTSGPSTAPIAQGSGASHPASTMPNDKARETYYMTAADPSGSDAPEERMNKLLKAKYDAGMLRPFNYVKGYYRLNRYMEQHMQPNSRQKILRQLDRFRPKFRERIESLTDIELVLVEMWFERSLMEYDRVFASMAVPACCWRRTGEIFRGNKEMAQLIHVPIESLRDVGVMADPLD